MKIQSILSGCGFLLFSCPIAALSADATAPTVPAVQSAIWTSTDYLKGAFTGAVGGLISGLVALVIGWMNNRNALKLNQQKIDADKEALEKSHKNQIEKICYEEKRKLCFELLQGLSEFTLRAGEFNLNEVARLYSMTSLNCGFRYSDYARQQVGLITNDRILKKSRTNYKIFLKEDEEKNEYHSRVNLYVQFYKMFTLITQKMLAGEELLPAREWNLDDFEGSVPLDYRKLLP